MLDFPDKVACIIWFAGCNMRCQYCYNIEIVKGKGKMYYGDAMAFLDSRKGLLDGVVLSGGECMLHPGIEAFIREIRERGFQIKIDTNGSNPRALQRLIEQQLVDYVALDFKAMKDRFFEITRSDLYPKFEKTLDLLKHSGVAYEVRTTVHSRFLDENQIHRMITFLENKEYRGTYYLQGFLNDIPTLGDVGNDANRVIRQSYHSEHFRIGVRNEWS
jgi:pyruvate formate lyase activating enzyme